MRLASILLWATGPVFLAACASPTLESSRISYVVDGKTISLEGARDQQLPGPGPARDSAWRYFGDTARGDLDGDGLEDLALLLVNEPGGSGTFYYVAAALMQAKGYRGTNTLFLGDRIAPHGISIKDRIITVNYAERPEAASFAEAPSVNISKYFNIKNERLYQTHVISQVTHLKWKWLYTQMNDDTVTKPHQKDAFTLVLRDDGRVMGTSDCNRFSGSYSSVDNKLVFGELLASRMYCEESQESVFIKQLGQVESYFLDNEDRLIMQLQYDSGAMVFGAD